MQGFTKDNKEEEKEKPKKTEFLFKKKNIIIYIHFLKFIKNKIIL